MFRLSSLLHCHPCHLSQIRQKGHSKWQNIQHIKKANDLRVGKLHQKYVNLINTAIRENGMQKDPALNRSLARIIEEAQSLDVRKATIDNAIKNTVKTSANVKEFLLEIRGPGRCAILVEALAANKGSIDTVINMHLKKNGGIQEKGCSSMFDKRGVVTVIGSKDVMSLDKAEEVAIDCGAEEVEEIRTEEGSLFEFVCSPTELMRVKGALVKAGLSVSSAEVRYLPNVWVSLSKVQVEAAFRLVDALNEKVDFVMAVHHNIEES